MANEMPSTRCVSVIMTVKNDALGAETTLSSLLHQTRPPDEIVICDGGSTDDTRDRLRRWAALHAHVRVLDAPGANIARGRNLAVAASRGDIIASTDAGCRADTQWLENLIAPFERDPPLEFVAGFYRVDPHSLFERVVGLATMRGQLAPVDPQSFNPSARSLACTRRLWERVGGFPEWLDFSEDTLFDHKVRRLGAKWTLVENAVVHWRPRSTWRSLARQFYAYGTGRGQTQIDAPSFHYNLRNVVMVFAAAVLSWINPWFLGLLIAGLLYFYWLPFHAQAVVIARQTNRPVAYLISLLVTWTVLFPNLAGYLVGSFRRIRCGRRGRRLMESYLSDEPVTPAVLS